MAALITPADIVAERFLARVDQGDGCWLWTGTQTHNGYGRHNVPRRFRSAFGAMSTTAHRFAYWLFVSRDIAGLDVEHLCGGPRTCVRPDHLGLATRKQNMARVPRELLAKASLSKTHCPAGHPYNAENTYIDPKRGQRHCRICSRAAHRAWVARQKEASVG